MAVANGGSRDGGGGEGGKWQRSLMDSAIPGGGFGGRCGKWQRSFIDSAKPGHSFWRQRRRRRREWQMAKWQSNFIDSAISLVVAVRDSGGGGKWGRSFVDSV